MLAHDEALTYGGRPGISSLHLIESAIGRPFSGYYRSLPEKCAALLHGLVNNHGFVDGNKRTAWILVEVLIERSGYSLTIADDEPIDDLVVSVATSEVDVAGLREWFGQRLVRR
ncbi:MULTISPECIES: type II toxin-antitoxin system death-on-curing family toxin [unclassified Marinovum]